MREVELRRLIVEEFLGVIEDPRVERTRKHPLETILVMSVLAVICGADSFVEIALYGRTKKEWLASFLDLSNGVPSARATDESARSARAKYFMLQA